MNRSMVLLITLFCVFTNITDARNYYPVDVGNTWTLESEDGTERVTYAIGATDELFNGKQGRLLRITTAVLGTTTAQTNTFFMEVNEEGIKLHRIVANLGDLFGMAQMEFSPPATFFPATLELGEMWQTQGETEISIVGVVRVTSENEVIAIEDVDTPAGTFEDCVKIRVRTKTAAAAGISRSTTYQWLAPDIGPVKFQTDQDIIFELISSNLIATESPYDVNADGVVNILDLTIVASRLGQADPKADVNADGSVNILDLTLVAQNLGN